jgi:hypothetical protein
VFCGGGTATWLLLWLGGTWQHVSGFGFAAAVLGSLALGACAPLLGALTVTSWSRWFAPGVGWRSPTGRTTR